MRRSNWRAKLVWKRMRIPVLLGVLTTLAITFGGPLLLGWGRATTLHHGESWRRRIRSPVWSSMSAIFQSPDDAPTPNTPAAAAFFDTLRTTPYADGTGPLGNPQPPFILWQYFESGWPLAAAYGWEHHAYTPYPQTSRAGLVDLPLLRFNREARQPLSIPFLPRWRGVIANSAFFGVCWWLVLLAISSTRRHIQHRILSRRGCCPTCRYDLTGLPANSPCPECGATASRSA